MLTRFAPVLAGLPARNDINEPIKTFRSSSFQLFMLLAVYWLFTAGGRAQTEPFTYSTVREISDHFAQSEVKQLQDYLNTAALQSRLTHYSCGDPVPKLS